MSFVARTAVSRTFRSVATRRGSAVARAYTTHAHLPEEHRMVYEMCRKFADEELAPNAGEWDKKHEFPQQAVTQLVSPSSVVEIAQKKGFETHILVSIMTHTGRTWNDGDQYVVG